MAPAGCWRGTEIVVSSGQFIPEVPLFYGNGGIERPLGGIENAAGTDPYDPSTWTFVTSGPSSYQASTMPFEASALDNPADGLQDADGDGIPNLDDPDVDGDGIPNETDGDYVGPAPPTYPHPYKIWASQNPLGQANIEAWFTNSAGSGNDPSSKLNPPPTSTYFNTADPTSPDYPYPVDASIPDVQNYSWDLWNKYKDDSNSPKLASGIHSGTYGTLAAPTVTFVTGTLQVSAGTSFQGAGILVIRDDFDPNTDTYNTPGIKAYLNIQGTFKWTGLVIVAGWAPTINVGSGGKGTIVGTVFGEDSVMSGGEVSLDSATITMTINGPFRIFYSNALFRKGGYLNHLLPRVLKAVVGIREI